MSTGKRSPIKDKPLRLPGQSLQEQRDRLFDGPILTALLLALVAIILAGAEWLRFAMESPPSPIFYTVVAAFAVAYAAWVFARNIPKVRALRQGIIGERAVGQFLDRLRESGYHVFHDVLGTDFNLDHVLIGPAGIFSAETKTWSKPEKGDVRVICEGDRLRVGMLEPDRNPIIQAKAQASWLRQLLAESTGRTFEVRPIILFPGWYVEQDAESRRQVWVLEPKALPAFLQHQDRRLSPEEIKLASFHLTRFIRSVERQRG